MKSFNIKNFIRGQVPEFVLDYHPIFFDFLVAYYQWLSEENDQEIPKSSMSDYLLKNTDIDRTIDLFLDSYRKTYLENFPVELALNQETGEKLNVRNLIKNIKRFYSAKGSEKSYRFLFRMIYNSEVDFYYPKQDVLRLSDGKWSSDYFIRIRTKEKTNPFELVGREIFQRADPLDETSTYYARAKVTEVIKKFLNNYSVSELKLENPVGSFLEDKEVYSITNDGLVSFGAPSRILRKITITNKGLNYKIGDRINFTETSGTMKGVLPSAFVSRTSSFGSSSGQVQEITIEDPGFMTDNILIGEPSIISQTPYYDNGGGVSGGATGFQASLTKGILFEAKGSYLNNDGKLSSNKYIQDNYFYQDYSYVLRTDKTIENFKTFVKELVHPAGFEIFSQIFLNKCVIASPSLFTQIKRKSSKRIGNYLPYTFKTYDDLSQWFDLNCYATGTHDSLIRNAAITGNPISSNVSFVTVTGSACVSGGITGGFSPNTEYGYWLVYSHPNTYLNNNLYSGENSGYSRGPITTRIFSNQLIDFYGSATAGTGQSLSGWQEWIYSQTNLGLTSQQISFFNQLYSSSSQETPLVNLPSTEFRKINIGAFLEEVVFDYDCRYPNRTILTEEEKDVDDKVDKLTFEPFPSLLTSQVESEAV